MKDEIKEILDRAKNLKYKCDCCEEIAPGKYMMRNDKQNDNLIEAVYIIDKLLDYITNLQQENERLKETLEEHDEALEKTFNSVAQLILRIDKAIEYIKNFSVDKSFSFPLMKRWEENQVKASIDYEFNDTLKKNLLNILQNGSDSQ